MAVPQRETNAFTLGKGKLLFQPGEAFNGEFRDLGNAPEVNLTIEVEKLEHFDSREGARRKDDEVIQQKTAGGTFILDDPNIENVKMFLLGGTIGEQNQTGAATQAMDDLTAAVEKWVEILQSSVNVFDISNVVVKDVTDTTTFVLGTDYELLTGRGMIRVLEGGGISEDDVLHITLDYATLDVYTVDALESDGNKGHVLFIGQPPKGKKEDFRGYCNITPSGDLAQIGDDWQQMTFDIEFLDHDQYTNLVEWTDRGEVA